jgi:hypothetical protein
MGDGEGEQFRMADQAGGAAGGAVFCAGGRNDGVALAAEGGQKEGLLFCEQKSRKKNFVPETEVVKRPGAQSAKVFWFFFSKKNRFLFAAGKSWMAAFAAMTGWGCGLTWVILPRWGNYHRRTVWLLPRIIPGCCFDLSAPGRDDRARAARIVQGICLNQRNTAFEADLNHDNRTS